MEPEFSTELYPKDGPLPIGCERFPLWYKVTGEMQACDMSRAILQGDPYPLRALYAHGMNFRMFPGAKEMEQALSQLEFFVDVDLFLTDSAKYADIVLPVCSSCERDEFKVFGGGHAQYTKPVIAPLFQSRRDDEIILELARRLEVPDKLLCSDRDTCIRYMLRNTPIDLDMLKAHPDLPQKILGLTIVPVGQHGFDTPTGKFELDSTLIKNLNVPGLDSLPTYHPSEDDADPESFPLILSTGIRIPGGLHSRLHDCPRPGPCGPSRWGTSARRTHSSWGLPRGYHFHHHRPRQRPGKGESNCLHPEGMVSLYHGYREADANSLLSIDHRTPIRDSPATAVSAAAFKRRTEYAYQIRRCEMHRLSGLSDGVSGSK